MNYLKPGGDRPKTAENVQQVVISEQEIKDYSVPNDSVVDVAGGRRYRNPIPMVPTCNEFIPSTPGPRCAQVQASFPFLFVDDKNRGQVRDDEEDPPPEILAPLVQTLSPTIAQLPMATMSSPPTYTTLTTTPGPNLFKDNLSLPPKPCYFCQALVVPGQPFMEHLQQCHSHHLTVSLSAMPPMTTLASMTATTTTITGSTLTTTSTSQSPHVNGANPNPRMYFNRKLNAIPEGKMATPEFTSWEIPPRPPPWQQQTNSQNYSEAQTKPQKPRKPRSQPAKRRRMRLPLVDPGQGQTFHGSQFYNTPGTPANFNQGRIICPPILKKAMRQPPKIIHTPPMQSKRQTQVVPPPLHYQGFPSQFPPTTLPTMPTMSIPPNPYFQGMNPGSTLPPMELLQANNILDVGDVNQNKKVNDISLANLNMSNCGIGMGMMAPPPLPPKTPKPVPSSTITSGEFTDVQLVPSKPPIDLITTTETPKPKIQQCPMCSYVTESPLNLKTHLDSYHVCYECPGCSMNILGRRNVMEHYKNFHDPTVDMGEYADSEVKNNQQPRQNDKPPKAKKPRKSKKQKEQEEMLQDQHELDLEPLQVPVQVKPEPPEVNDTNNNDVNKDVEMDSNEGVVRKSGRGRPRLRPITYTEATFAQLQRTKRGRKRLSQTTQTDYMNLEAANANFFQHPCHDKAYANAQFMVVTSKVDDAAAEKAFNQALEKVLGNSDSKVITLPVHQNVQPWELLRW